MAWEAGLIFPIMPSLLGLFLLSLLQPALQFLTAVVRGRKKAIFMVLHIVIKSVLYLGRFSQMSVVGHLRPDFISVKLMGIFGIY